MAVKKPDGVKIDSLILWPLASTFDDDAGDLIDRDERWTLAPTDGVDLSEVQQLLDELD
jgi:hypothetical protein